MPLVERDRISGHQPVHDLAERDGICLEEEMELIRDQSPGVALGLGLIQDTGKPFQKRVSVCVVFEEPGSFDPLGLPDIGFAFRRGGRAVT
mgnify:CR=1 FL=1